MQTCWPMNNLERTGKLLELPGWNEQHSRTGQNRNGVLRNPVKTSPPFTTGRVSVGYRVKVDVEFECVNARLGCQQLAADQSVHVGMVSQCGRRGGRERWPMRTHVAEWQIGRITLKLHLTPRAWMNDKSGTQSTDHNPSERALIPKVIGSTPGKNISCSIDGPNESSSKVKQNDSIHHPPTQR